MKIDFEKELAGIHFEEDTETKEVIDSVTNTNQSAEVCASDTKLPNLFEQYMDNEDAFYGAQEQLKTAVEERRRILGRLKAITNGKPFLVKNGDGKRFLVRVYGFGVLAREMEEIDFFDFAL